MPGIAAVDGTGSRRVLVLHGWASDSTTWSVARRSVDRRRFTYAYVDFPGYGVDRPAATTIGGCMSTYGSTTADGPGAAGEAQGASSAEQAKQKVQETTQQAAGQARGRLREQVDQRSTQAGEQVASTADDVRIRLP